MASDGAVRLTRSRYAASALRGNDRRSPLSRGRGSDVALNLFKRRTQRAWRRRMRAPRLSVSSEGGRDMRKLLVSVALIALAASGALSGARAADMSFERALNADREPQNWLLHHKNYQGHRFSVLKEIND